jgi:hypothetical protein
MIKPIRKIKEWIKLVLEAGVFCYGRLYWVLLAGLLLAVGLYVLSWFVDWEFTIG